MAFTEIVPWSSDSLAGTGTFKPKARKLALIFSLPKHAQLGWEVQPHRTRWGGGEVWAQGPRNTQISPPLSGQPPPPPYPLGLQVPPSLPWPPSALPERQSGVLAGMLKLPGEGREGVGRKQVVVPPGRSTGRKDWLAEAAGVQSAQMRTREKPPPPTLKLVYGSGWRSVILTPPTP